MPEPRSDASRPPVVVVTGPTASGKSALAIRLAERFGGEIVNADSMQVYRYLNIGTAKPGPLERARVPHHLYDVVTPDVAYSAGRYLQAARAAAAAIHARGRAVLLTGGTGLYIRAFLHGLVEEGGGADAELRRSLEREHASACAEGDPLRLHRRLVATDPEAAAGIHPHDLRRIVRALEICARAGRPASAVRAEQDGACPYRVLHLALDPGVDELDARIDARCQQMIEAGLLQECRELLERGYRPSLRPLQSIGYRHMWPVVDGSDTLASARVVMQRDTRRFARRQRTWLRGVRDAVWMDPRDEAGIAKAVAELLA
jgi:tRNA dimethylallyltransferase